MEFVELVSLYSDRKIKMQVNCERSIVITSISDDGQRLNVGVDRNELIDAVSRLDRYEEPWTGRVYYSTTDELTMTILSEPDANGRMAYLTQVPGEGDMLFLDSTEEIKESILLDLYERLS